MVDGDEYMEDRIRCDAVGISSLFFDGKEGTNDERHVVFVDLDGLDPITRPADFRSDVRRVMLSLGIADFYAFQTLKGVHLFSPDLVTRKVAERAEERLEPWGGDGFHRFMGYVNGETVLRVTAKPGEGDGPALIAHFRVPLRPAWSGDHYDFFHELHPSMPEPAGDRAASAGRDGFRLHHYQTTASISAINKRVAPTVNPVLPQMPSSLEGL